MTSGRFSRKGICLVVEVQGRCCGHRCGVIYSRVKSYGSAQEKTASLVVNAGVNAGASAGGSGGMAEPLQPNGIKS